MARTPKVAVVGGGIGGLVAALALHQRGIEVAVYEQSPELGEIGAGLNLSPNALKAFRALGVEDAAMAVGFHADDQVVRSWRSARVIARQKRGANIAERFGASFLCMHRADLLDILSHALPGNLVRLGARCSAVENHDGGARMRFADGREEEADVVVGADGIHSAVRESLFGPIEPHFTGCICWRGLVPVETVAHTDYGRDMTAWWGPHGHIVHYPVRRGELINFVAHFDSDSWTEESWVHECDRAELLETYEGWNASLLKMIESSERYYKWALYDRDPLDHWGKGRITLLGDSAHPMLPYLGQGACMAVEDGCVLAAKVAESPDDLDAALHEYESSRKPRTTRAQLGSRHRAKENHLASPAARLWRDIKMGYRNRFGADKSPTRAEWLYDYDVGTEMGFSIGRGS